MSSNPDISEASAVLTSSADALQKIPNYGSVEPKHTGDDSNAADAPLIKKRRNAKTKKKMDTETRVPRGQPRAPTGDLDLTKSQMFAALFFRLVLPLALVSSFTLRVNGFSSVFLLLFLVHPFVPSPGKPKRQTLTKLFLYGIIVAAVLFLLAQMSFLAASYADTTLPEKFTCNESMSDNFYDIGLGDLYHAEWWVYFVYLGPEAVLILCSFCSILTNNIALNSLKPKSKPKQSRASRQPAPEQQEAISHVLEEASNTTSKFQRNFAYVIGLFNICTLICAACCVPSLISITYLMVFLTIGTGHSLMLSNFLTTGINSLSYVLVLVSALHAITLYLFQFHFIASLVDFDSTWLRLTGIKRILDASCIQSADNNVIDLYVHDLPAEYYAQPFVILLLYYLIAHYTGFWSQFSHFRDLSAPDNAHQDGHAHNRRSSYLTPALRHMLSSSLGNKSDKFFESARRVWTILVKSVSSLTYLLSVAVQIIWSVWCLGLVGLVLLLVAIYLWVRSNTKIRTLNAAPFLVVFCTLYIIVQFVFNLDYKEGEFVSDNRTFHINDFNITISLEDVRLINDSVPNILYLGLQCLFLAVFWASLRSYMNFYYHRPDPSSRHNFTTSGMTSASEGLPLGPIPDHGDDSSSRNSETDALLDGIKEGFSAVWMSVCVLVLLFVSTHGFPTAINIVYMIFFLVFANYTVFRVASGTADLPDFEKFFKIILLFTMTALCVIYIYQFSFFFDQFDFFADNKDVLSQFGLTGSVSDTVEIVYPTAVLLIVIKIQFDFFGDSFQSFMRHFSTDSSTRGEEFRLEGFNEDAPRSEVNSTPRVQREWSLRQKIQRAFTYIREKTFALIVIHTDKIFLILLSVAIIQEVSAVNVGFLVFFVLMCLLPFQASEALKRFLFVLTCVVVVVRMVYQNQLINENLNYTADCGNHSIDDRNFLEPNLNKWIGLNVYGDQSSIRYLWFYLLLIVCVLIESLCHCRMHAKVASLIKKTRSDDRKTVELSNSALKRLTAMLSYRILFPDVTRSSADDNLLSMIKFVINYLFYKFGFEITAFTVILNCGKHADAYSAVYMTLLLLMCLSPRKKLRGKAYVLSLVTATFLVLKFVFLLWLPPLDFFCGFDGLDWLEHPNLEIDVLSLKRFFFIPDFSDPEFYSISASRLFGDFFQLLVLRSLLINLGEEKVPQGLLGLNSAVGNLAVTGQRRKYMPEVAGNNDECLSSDGEASSGSSSNELRHQRICYSKTNFITDEKDTLNVIKKVIFNHGIWVTYGVVCLTGMQDVDVFGFIFFGLGFYLLWIGQDIALLQRRRIILYVNRILTYTLFTCFIRILMQLVSFYCYNEHFPDDKFFVKFLKLFDITLLNKYSKIATNYLDYRNTNLSCEYSRVKADLFDWETACVVFLLIQRRIFYSHYYDFVMAEAKISRDLSKEGGSLIQKLNKDDLKSRIALRNRISEQLQSAIEQIKKRMQGDTWVEPKTHIQAIFTGEKFFGKNPGEEKILRELEEFDNYSLFFKDPATFDEDQVSQKWKKFTDYVKLKLSIEVEEEAKPDRTSTEATVGTADEEGKEEDEDMDGLEMKSDSAAEDKDDEDKEAEGAVAAEGKGHGHSASVNTLHGSEGYPSALVTVSKGTYYVVFVVTVVLCEIGIILDRVSSNFRYVIEELKKIRKNDPKFQEQSIVIVPNAPIRQPIRTQSILVKPTDVAIEIGEGKSASVKPKRRRSVTSTSAVLDNPDGPPNVGEFWVLLLKNFWLSFYYFVVAQTDYLCYFMITLSLLLNGSIADAILALLTLLWGLLSKPRPSKTFWTFCITYIVGLILLKYCLKFKAIPWNEVGNDVPNSVTLFFGVQNDDNMFVVQLLLLISLCFHRNILVDFGLWIGYHSSVKEGETAAVEEGEEADISMNQSETQSLLPPIPDEAGTSAPVDTVASDQALIVPASSDVEEGQNAYNDDCEDGEGNESSWKASLKEFALNMKEEFVDFFKNLLDADNTAVKDVYAPMFFFDAFGYLIVIFGYHGFSISSDDTVSSGGTLVSIVSENQVPVLFLAIVLIMFFYQLADRLAYLTKNVNLKIVIFTSQVLLVHFWLIIWNKGVTGLYFSENHPAQVFYFFRWIYWLLSAYQIKCSYPVRVLGNFFSKRYNMFFKVCMLVFVNMPFAFEIRVLMDWIFTGTTLSFNRWLEVEDVFTSTFILNCTRIGERQMNQKRGQTQKVLPSKIIYFAVLLVLLFVIWGPILLFSFVNSTKVSTEVTYTSFELQVGSYLPIFEASQIGIDRLGSEQFTNDLEDELSNFDLSLGFFLTDSADFSKVLYSGESENIWTITPPAEDQLITDLLNFNDSMVLYVNYQFYRVSLSDSASTFPSTSTGSTTIELDEDARTGLANILNGKVKSVIVYNVIPTVYYIQDSGAVSNETVTGDINSEWYSIRLSLSSTSSEPKNNGLKWWVVEPSRNPTNDNDWEETLDIYIVMEKVVPDAYSAVANYGILGLYTAFVLLVANLVKGAFTGFSTKIMWDEIPDVSLLQTLTKEIYLSRETKNYELEEDLYSQLQYLYRSPDVLIKNTKLKID